MLTNSSYTEFGMGSNTGLENNQPSSSHQTQSDSMANYGEQDSLLDDHKYATDVSDPNYRGQ